jgi:hypothetical protein
MKKLWQYLIPFIDSLLIHMILLGILLIGVNLPQSSPNSPRVAEEIQVINENAVLAEMERLKREEAFKKATQDAQAYALKQKQEAYKKIQEKQRIYLEKLRKKQQAEKHELEQLKQRRLAAEKKLDKLSREKAKLE